MAVGEVPHRCCQIGEWIGGVELTCLDERGNGGPIFRAGIMTCKQCVLAIEDNRPDGSLDAVAIDLDAPISQQELTIIPVFADVSQG